MRFAGRALSKILLLSFLVSASGFATVQETDVFSDWILDGDWAYGMMRPEAVAPSGATEVEWTGDGSSLIILHSERPSESQALDEKARPPTTIVSTWSRRSGRTREILRADVDSGWISISPLGVSPRVVLTCNNMTRLLDTGSGLLKPLLAPEGFSVYPAVDISPDGSRFLMIYSTERPDGDAPAPLAGEAQGKPVIPDSFVKVLDSNGTLLAAGRIPGRLVEPQWSKDEWPVFRPIRTREDLNPSDRYVLSPAGLRPYSGAILAHEEAESTQLRTTVNELGGGDKSVKIRSGWLDAHEKSEMGHALICADVEDRPILSPSGDAVAYIARGVPMVRRILKMPKAEFEKMLKSAVQNRAMSNAKQTALAMEMYASDYDDAFPLGGSFQDGIDPYMKNRDLSRDFVYTFGGGLFPKDADPTKLELGFIQTAYGRAVAFGDGHVQWYPNP